MGGKWICDPTKSKVQMGVLKHGHHWNLIFRTGFGKPAEEVEIQGQKSGNLKENQKKK